MSAARQKTNRPKAKPKAKPKTKPKANSKAVARKPAPKMQAAPVAATPAQQPPLPAIAARGGQGNETVRMVRELAAIVERRGLTELVVDTEDLTLTLRRGETAGPTVATHMPTFVHAAPVMADASQAPAPATAAAAAPADDIADATNGEHHLVTSPFVGTFYRRPNPDSDMYVSAGQRVEKGQVLCIVEAMKLMNEIEADMAGVIAAILVQDAEPVEYGQALFKISPG